MDELDRLMSLETESIYLVKRLLRVWQKSDYKAKKRVRRVFLLAKKRRDRRTETIETFLK